MQNAKGHVAIILVQGQRSKGAGGQEGKGLGGRESRRAKNLGGYGDKGAKLRPLKLLNLSPRLVP